MMLSAKERPKERQEAGTAKAKEKAKEASASPTAEEKDRTGRRDSTMLYLL